MIRGTLDRQPVRADSRHRPDHRLVRRLCDREEDLARRRRRFGTGDDRGRRLPGSLDAFLGAGRFHPDHEPRHSGRRRDGADARRADDPGHRARPAADQPSIPDIFWGLIASFWIGNIMLVVLNVPMIGLWVKLLMIPYRYLYPSALFFVCIGVYVGQQRHVPGRRDAGHRRLRLYAAAARLPSGADPARLRARPALRGEFPPRHADLARRPR